MGARSSNARLSRARSGLTDFGRTNAVFQRASSGLTDLRSLSATVFSRAGSGLTVTDLRHSKVLSLPQRPSTSEVNTEKRSSKFEIGFEADYQRKPRTAPANSSFKRTNSGRLLRSKA